MTLRIRFISVSFAACALLFANSLVADEVVHIRIVEHDGKTEPLAVSVPEGRSWEVIPQSSNWVFVYSVGENGGADWVLMSFSEPPNKGPYMAGFTTPGSLSSGKLAKQAAKENGKVFKASSPGARNAEIPACTKVKFYYGVYLVKEYRSPAQALEEPLAAVRKAVKELENYRTVEAARAASEADSRRLVEARVTEVVRATFANAIDELKRENAELKKRLAALEK